MKLNIFAGTNVVDLKTKTELSEAIPGDIFFSTILLQWPSFCCCNTFVTGLKHFFQVLVTHS